MPAPGRKPAAVETLRADDKFIRFGGRPFELFVHGLFGQAADDPRGDKDDQGQYDQEGDKALFHNESSAALRQGSMLACALEPPG
jgi:hypothetical protein